MKTSTVLGPIVALVAVGSCVTACRDDDSARSDGNPTAEPQAESTTGQTIPFPPLSVDVAWAAEALHVNLFQRHNDPNISMTCNDVASERTSPGDIVYVELPAAGAVDVDCSISNGMSFHLDIPGLDRLRDGEFRRDAASEAVLATCGRTTSQTYDAVAAAWNPGAVWLDCTNEIVSYEPNPAGEILLFHTDIEG